MTFKALDDKPLITAEEKILKIKAKLNALRRGSEVLVKSKARSANMIGKASLAIIEEIEELL
jgi:hypothetical protein